MIIAVIKSPDLTPKQIYRSVASFKYSFYRYVNTSMSYYCIRIEYIEVFPPEYFWKLYSDT